MTLLDAGEVISDAESDRNEDCVGGRLASVDMIVRLVLGECSTGWISRTNDEGIIRTWKKEDAHQRIGD